LQDENAIAKKLIPDLIAAKNAESSKMNSLADLLMRTVELVIVSLLPFGSNFA
jgi:hypothetical protein